MLYFYSLGHYFDIIVAEKGFYWDNCAMKLDRADRRLLEALQRDASLSQGELAEIAGMSR